MGRVTALREVYNNPFHNRFISIDHTDFSADQVRSALTTDLNSKKIIADLAKTCDYDASSSFEYRDLEGKWHIDRTYDYHLADQAKNLIAEYQLPREIAIAFVNTVKENYIFSSAFETNFKEFSGLVKKVYLGPIDDLYKK